MKLQIIASIIVAARPFLEFHWIDSDCVEIPDISFIYDDDKKSNAYNLITTTDSFEFCGYKDADIDRCCHGSLDTNLSFGYQGTAATYQVNESSDWKTVPFPYLTKPTLFCKLSSNSTDLFSSAIIKSNSGCVLNQIQCINDTIVYYSLPGCQGTRTELKNEQWVQVLNNSLLTSTVTLQKGELTYHWVSYYPPENFYPTNHQPFEAFGSFCGFLACAILFFCFLFDIYRYYKQKRTLRYLIATSHLLWFFYVTLAMVYWYLVGIPLSTVAILKQCRDTLFNLASLMTVWINMNTFFDIFWDISNTTQILSKCLLLFVHVTCSGANYFSYFIAFELNGTRFFSLWQKSTTGYWVLVMLVCDTLMILFMFRKIIKVVIEKNHSKNHIVSKRNMYFIVICQTIVSILYYCLLLIRNHTFLLLNDRGYACVVAVNMLLYSLHCIFSNLAYEEFPKMIRQVVKKPPKVKINENNTAFIDTVSLRNKK